jgi:hypothetical protein
MSPPPGYKRKNATSASDVEEEDEVEVDNSAASIWLHIYHCDPYTGFLNQKWLASREMGIYHAGVEVFGEEWSFQYFEDTWNDPTISGLIRCRPRQMTDYEYQESINLGPTPLSQFEVNELLRRLIREWPACNYHLTRNNCLTFAETLISELQVPGSFPTRLRSILDASNNNSAVGGIVDYSWSWLKWWMIRKHRLEEEEAAAPAAGQDQGQGGLWPSYLSCSTCTAQGEFEAGDGSRPGPVPAPR